MVDQPYSHYKKRTVAEQYDKQRFASIAGRAFDKLEKQNILKAFHGVARGSLILDAPCGTGRLAEALLEEGFRVVGMDISSEMLEVAQDKLARFGDRFSVKTADLRHPLESEQQHYDAALCARVLVHLPLAEQITFLKNVTQLTRGRVVITQSLNSFYQRRRRYIKKLLGHQTPVQHPVTTAELVELLSGAGLKQSRMLRPMPLVSEEVIVAADR